MESLAEDTPVAPAVTEFMGPLEGMMTEPPGAAAGAAETGTAPPGATRALTGAATAGGGGAPVGPGGGPPEDIAVRPGCPRRSGSCRQSRRRGRRGEVAFFFRLLFTGERCQERDLKVDQTWSHRMNLETTRIYFMSLKEVSLGRLINHSLS